MHMLSLELDKSVVSYTRTHRCKKFTKSELALGQDPVHEALRMPHMPMGYDHLPTPCNKTFGQRCISIG